MANGFIQVPADSTGKKLQTFENTVGANTVEAEAVVLVDNTGANACNVNGSGQLPVAVGNTPSVNQGTSPWLTRQNDGTNTETTLFDVDSSGVTHQFVQGVSLRKSGSGGSVELGTSSNPIRTDPTGTTTQPISAASLPLPTGAATAAKQPALGTAGSASTDVITIQGIASMTAVKVDGSGVTQPVSGTVTANLSGSISNTGFNVTPATSGGTSAYHAVAAASNNAAAVKASAGQVYGWSIYNNSTYPVYVKLYNKATAPAPATDNALLIRVIGVQSGTHVDHFNECGIAGFSSGIGIAAVKGITDTDNTSLALSDCLIEIDYK